MTGQTSPNEWWWWRRRVGGEVSGFLTTESSDYRARKNGARGGKEPRNGCQLQRQSHLREK